MFRWEDLALTLAILRHGSLNQAAMKLGIRQSTASRRLSRIEDQLGSPLFDRTPEGMAPTQLALELRSSIEEIELRMADIHRVVSVQQGMPSGTVRVALADGLASEWLIPGLADFYRNYPAITLDLVIGHAVVDLVRREADIAVRFIRPTAPDLVAQHITRLPLAPYIHPSLVGIPPEDLCWLLFDDPDARYLETRWVKEYIQPDRTMRVSVWNALFAAVVHGIGAAILAPWVAERAGLVRLDNVAPVASRDVFLVYHRALRNVPRIAAVRTWLQERAQVIGPDQDG